MEYSTTTTTFNDNLSKAVNNKRYLISVALIGVLVTQVNSAASVFGRYYDTGSPFINVLDNYIFAISVELFVFITIKYGKIGLAIAGAIFSSIINLIHTGLPAHYNFTYLGACFLDLLVPCLIICYSLLVENRIKYTPRKYERKPRKKSVGKVGRPRKVHTEQLVEA